MGTAIGVAVAPGPSDSGVSYVRYGNGFQNVVVNKKVGAEVGDVIAIFEHHIDLAALRRLLIFTRWQ